jgi:uncharacterized protein YdhG (YjbR/CyaY superfamily)
VKAPDSIDAYIEALPAEVQTRLRQIRKEIKKIAPRAEEAISYGIPAFNLNGTYLIYMAGYKKHVSIYPAPRGVQEFRKELSKYKGGKGTVQFPLDEPLPMDLIRRIVKYRLSVNKERAQKMRATKVTRSRK